MIDIATAGWWQHEDAQAALDGAARLAPLWSVEDMDAAGVALADIRGMLAYTGGMPITREVIARLPALEIIVVKGAGTDVVDAAAAAERGIVVRNCPAANTEDVAELAFGLLLAAGRGIVSADAHIRQGEWVNVTSRRVSGRTLGLFGMGNIGRAVARRAEAFGMPVLYTSRSSQADLPYPFVSDLRELAARADCLVVAAPAVAETHHAINREVLEALGPQGVLVNIARGSLVDEAALIACLSDGRLGAAGLDVFADEPRVPEALRALPNVVLSPHNGANTHEAFAAVLAKAVAALREHFKLAP
ncbi:NAD(P)-dependent oxidoreductase [Caenibius sp. WL]|uniref:NAD(P)-dependent oxidoreductase n=1 Tax=Caenibius sp. WL TaxID=2872646 RepID=UPI001C98F395|nr:NAD(P)-dependent oxidoreductase [Caenibius sp. WL]QZP08439.1 2-hydroxyacid dehydrogenase [Caenibius sp. WL]